MRILVTQESDWITRGPHQQHQLFDRLSERGHQIRVIDYDIDWKKWSWWQGRQVFGGVHKVKDDAKVLVIRPGMIRIPILSYVSSWFTHLSEIKRQIKEFKPDVIVGFGILNADLSVLLKGKIPFVYYWIDILHMLIPLKWMRWLGKIMEMETLLYSDRVIVINESLKEYVLKYESKEVDVIGAGVDLKTFKPSDLSIRERYGIKPDDVVLFFMGYVYPFSGLDKVAKNLLPKQKLMVVGDGESFNQLCQYNNVIMVNKVPYNKIPDYINASDICILPAENNDTMEHIVPIKIYEYMALRKPIISTRLSGVVSEFGEGNGIVYVDEAKDIPYMVSYVKIRYEKLSNQAWEYIVNRDWGMITNKFESILKECVYGKESVRMVKK